MELLDYISEKEIKTIFSKKDPLNALNKSITIVDIQKTRHLDGEFRHVCPECGGLRRRGQAEGLCIPCQEKLFREAWKSWEKQI